MKQKVKLFLLPLLLILLLLSGCGKTPMAQEHGEPSATQGASAQKDAPVFRKHSMLKEHYQKHVVDQKEFGSITIEEYLAAAQALVTTTDSTVLTKTEKDGDTVFYRENTNEYGVLSKDGYIRTYFKPDRGIQYFNRD